MRGQRMPFLEIRIAPLLWIPMPQAMILLDGLLPVTESLSGMIRLQKSGFQRFTTSRRYKVGTIAPMWWPSWSTPTACQQAPPCENIRSCIFVTTDPSARGSAQAPLLVSNLPIKRTELVRERLSAFYLKPSSSGYDIGQFMSSSTISSQLSLTLFIALSHFSPPNARATSCIL